MKLTCLRIIQLLSDGQQSSKQPTIEIKVNQKKKLQPIRPFLYAAPMTDFFSGSPGSGQPSVEETFPQQSS